MDKKRPAGFTIVELLIVIVVIAILAAISVVAYTGIQQRARDTQRVQDIQNIAKALKLHYAATGSYPSGHIHTADPNFATSSFYSAISPYMANTPVDPREGSGHHYLLAGNAACANSTERLWLVAVGRFETSSPETIDPCSGEQFGSHLWPNYRYPGNSRGAFVSGYTIILHRE